MRHFDTHFSVNEIFFGIKIVLTLFNHSISVSVQKRADRDRKGRGEGESCFKGHGNNNRYLVIPDVVNYSRLVGVIFLVK